MNQCSDAQFVFVFEKKKGSEREFPIRIGIVEAYELDRTIKGIKPSRPTTADMIVSVIKGMGASLERLVICNLRKHIFYGMQKMANKSKTKKSVIVVDEYVEFADRIATLLRNSERFNFEVKYFCNIENCVSMLEKPDGPPPDMFIVNIDFQHEGQPAGARIVDVFSKTLLGVPILAYCREKAHTPRIVEIMRKGAWDLQDEVASEETLVSRAEEILDEAENSGSRLGELKELQRAEGSEWQNKYPDEHIVVVGKDVVAHGENKLSVLLGYDGLRSGHSDWPADPDVIFIKKFGVRLK